jgi:outer membrane murein-binding lipoprotein Lpp
MDMASTVIIPDNPKEMKAAISQMLRQIDDIREQMKASDADIARMNAQYDVTRAETLSLRGETESILARLRKAI